ncbi:MAG: HEAT repeat domain-containing protein [Spirochaetota bacterium]
MDAVIKFVTNQPLEYLIAAGAAVAIALLVPIASVARRVRFRKRIRRFLEQPDIRRSTDVFDDAELLRRSRTLEHMAEREGEAVVEALELDRLWTERLYEKERPGDFRRVLRWGTDKGLFACFLMALRNRRYARMLRGYLADHSDFVVLRRLALSGRGDDFSGRKARDFFADRIDEVREMTGDPEWASRYFAVKILLHDEDERSDRALREAFSDPHPLIRKTVVTEYGRQDREVLAERLRDIFLHDPVFEVRSAARARIRDDFADLYALDASSLDSEEALHVIELLDPSHPDDVNAAMELLAGRSLELRLSAARFLGRTGKLRELFLQADFADQTELARIRELLLNALEVNVVDFLDAVTDQPGPASLLIAAELLARHGSSTLIVEIAERVFRLQRQTTDHFDEIYSRTVEAIAERGTEDARHLLAREITRRHDQPDLLRVALAGVPAGADQIFAPVLLAALRDPEFPEREALRTAFTRLDTPLVLSTCIDIITADRDANPHRVRIDALMTLGELGLPYTLQDILEHLPILPVDTAREFTALLNQQQPKQLERKVAKLLESVDGNIRASVIAALPATGKKTFLNEIKAALDDADPDVRIAATWSLVDYEETRALNQAVGMLRDPVQRVRESVAHALAIGGGRTALDALRETLTDENEVDVVKRAAIRGLGSSDQPDAVDVLVDVLQGEDELADAAADALAEKAQGASVRRLVERFKDADPALRDRITGVFTRMGEQGEPVIRELLEEEIESLRPLLAEILETTGYVENRIRLLSNRDPRVRRDAADFLARVGSEAAFRGIVMAARDPDSEVRVQVTKALERLASEDGKGILRALENDPDRRIRKYTHWALQRLEAKSL